MFKQFTASFHAFITAIASQLYFRNCHSLYLWMSTIIDGEIFYIEQSTTQDLWEIPEEKYVLDSARDRLNT